MQANQSIAEDGFFLWLDPAAAPVQENGQLKTTKVGGGLHGWGLKSAQTAAEKYDGCVQAGVYGEVFRAVATLSFSGTEDIYE